MAYAAARAALDRIPGWRHASAVQLSGGLSNRSFLVDNGQQRAVLKIDPQPRALPYNSRADEARVQTAAAAAGLAARVLYSDERCYLSEFLAGEVWTPASFGNDAALAELAAAIRRLHALPSCGRRFDGVAAARHYVQHCAPADRREAAACLALVESMPPPQSRCLSHNDLVAGNIVATPALCFIDWEYACDNDPLFDLATVISHHGLPDERAGQLLDAYFDGDGERWQAGLRRQAEGYDALRRLWQMARRAGATSGS